MNEQETVSFEPLRAAILEDARAAAAARLADAASQAEEILRQARESANAYRQERLAETDANFQADKKVLLNRTSLDAQRAHLVVQEQTIQTILQAALKDTAAADATAREKSVETLLQEALVAMGETPCTVLFNPEKLPFITDEWLVAHAPASFRSPIVGKPDTTMPDGIIVKSNDGACTFDNTYAMRLQRLMPDLRLLVIEGIAADSETNSKE